MFVFAERSERARGDYGPNGDVEETPSVCLHQVSSALWPACAWLSIALQGQLKEHAGRHGAENVDTPSSCSKLPTLVYKRVGAEYPAV